MMATVRSGVQVLHVRVRGSFLQSISSTLETLQRSSDIGGHDRFYKEPHFQVFVI